ncbi:MAG: hypothetical protein JXB48_12555 [Candidatus Latescibacteria bacterium]|nr:hypothetical protein [Candidatus Latescibacterota bacterium]
MKRRDAVRMIPLTLAGIGELVKKVNADQMCSGICSAQGQIPAGLQYQKNVLDMLTRVRENQSENLLESAYAIARTLRKGRSFWLNWDQGHSTNAEMFPERCGMPLFCKHGYNIKEAKDGDALMINRILSKDGYDDLAKKDILVIGGPSPWSGDNIGYENIRDDIRPLQNRPFSDIWIETNITCLGAIMQIPGMPAPIGPISGPVYMTILWMILADACRVLSIEGKSFEVDGDEPKLSGDRVNWINTADPLLDNFLDIVRREMELIGAELGNIRQIAKMAVDTLLDGGTVYYYSRYRYSFATEATGRRGGFAFAKGLDDENIAGTSKDCVIMGTYKPDDEADLKNLDKFRANGMRIASLGPITRNFQIPEGRTVHKETDVHVGRMMDTYGVYAIPGFDKKVCPTSGIIMFTINWAISMEIIEMIRQRTGGNVPGVNFSGALKWGSEFNSRVRSMATDRGY